jgi:hypothetical protein
MSCESTNPGHLREVQLSTLSPVMWAEGRTYPRATMAVPIHPYDPSLGGLGSCCGAVPFWNRSNSIANLRPIGFGDDAPEGPSAGFWVAFLAAAAGSALVFWMLSRWGQP